MTCYLNFIIPCDALNCFPVLMQFPAYRNLLGYLLVSSREWKDVHVATRCSVVDLYDHKNDACVKSGFEIVGAGAAACYTRGHLHEKLAFSTCREQRLFEAEPILQLQKYVLL